MAQWIDYNTHNNKKKNNRQVRNSHLRSTYKFANCNFSGDLKSNHSKSRNIQNPDFLKIKFQMVWFLKGQNLDILVQILNGF